MKMTVKCLGIAVLAVMMVFALIACGDGGGGGGGSTPGGGNTVINTAAIVVTAPGKGAAPSTNATVEDNGNFTIGSVSWSPADNPFLGGKVYTVSVMLTAKNGYTFTGLTSASINGQNAEVSNNVGSTVKLSHTFPATDTKTVTAIKIKSQPTKLTYTHGDTLDLTGLAVTLTHDDNTTEDVAAANFGAKNVTANPSAGNSLVYLTHNGQPVKIIYGSLTCNTNNLTVNPIAVTFNSVTANGSALQTTTELILTFSQAITNLSANDITISGISGVTKGDLRYNGSGLDYSLDIYGFTAGGTLTVTVAKPGFSINGTPKTVDIYYKLVIEMVQIPGGSFDMGSNNGNSNERPVHTVTLSSFYMGKYEVTQEQWAAVMGSNPSYFNGSPASGEIQWKRPVEWVSWYDALVFCNKLSIKEGLNPAYSISGSTDPASWGAVPTSYSDPKITTWDAVTIVAGSTGYRLPTEAQWEYAARGGNGSPGNYEYSGSNTIGDVAWYLGNSGCETHEVGKKAPNGLGLYDMSGNVYEWCWDCYESYSSGAQTDPTGGAVPWRSYRVFRGGSWGGDGQGLRSAFREYYYPYECFYTVGFRLVRSN